MILVAITMLLTAAMVLNHAVHGFFCWGFHPGGSLSATIYDLQILAAVIGLLRLTVSLLRRTVPCEWIQIIAIGAFGLASAATYMLFGWRAHTSAHWQGPENLIAFQTVACTTYLIGRYGGTPKPRRRWLRSSLRTLLAVMLVVILVLGCGFRWFAYKIKRTREQREVVKAIEKLGGYISERPTSGGVAWATVTWLGRFAGEDLASDVTMLALRETQVPDAGLEHLRGLTQLQELSLHSTQVPDAGVNDPQKALSNVKVTR